MEIRNLKTFLRVAALSSFTQAGQELGYSQANISAQIKQLETELGTPLFDRVGRQVRITPYGETLLGYARTIVAAEAEALSIATRDTEMTGTLRLGLPQSVAEQAAEIILSEFCSRYPAMRLELTVDATAALSECLSHGSLDIACLIDDAPSEKLRYLAAFEAGIVLAAHPDHPLARRGPVHLQDLQGQRMILMEQSAPYTAQFLAALTAAEVEPRVILQVQSPALALRLVQREPVLAFLPRYSVREASENGRVRILPLDGVRLRQSVMTAVHPGTALTPPLRAISDSLRDALSSMLPA